MKVSDLEIEKNVCFVYLTIEDEKYVMEIPKNRLLNALKSVEIWQNYSSNSFNIKLIELIAKADNENKAKLLKAFPEFVIVYLLWFYKEIKTLKFADDEEFFEYMSDKLEN